MSEHIMGIIRAMCVAYLEGERGKEEHANYTAHEREAWVMGVKINAGGQK